MIHKCAPLVINIQRVRLGSWSWERSIKATPHLLFGFGEVLGKVIETSLPGICLYFQQRKTFTITTATQIQRREANRDGNSNVGIFLWNSSVVKRPVPIQLFTILGSPPPGKYWTLADVMGWIVSPQTIKVLTHGTSEYACLWNRIFKE